MKLLVGIALGLGIAFTANAQGNDPWFKVEGKTLTVIDGAGKTLVNVELGLVVDGKDITEGGLTSDGIKYSIAFEKYHWKGNKSLIDRTYSLLGYNGKSAAGDWKLYVRAYKDGIAFCYELPEGSKRVEKELTKFKLPDDARVWWKINKPQYEIRYNNCLASELPDSNIQIPTTVKLASGRYLSIAEGGGFTDWPGMSFEVGKDHRLNAFYADNQKGFDVKGKRSPWRVIMTGPTLNELVNCDIIPDVSPAPDHTQFPNGTADWIQGGRCLWQWWAYSDAGTKWENQHKMVDQAAELNCQYYLVDAGWENPKYGWCTEMGQAWDSMKQLVDYAKTKNVKILAWRSWRDCGQGPGVETPEKLALFFENCERVGILGVKVDYWASESQQQRELIDLLHRTAAKHKIMVNPHGCAKPAGEQRTYPFSLTREGILGLEHNKWGTVNPDHYCNEPFLRCLAGNADFTPVTFQPKMLKGTTCAFQLATALIYTSPLLTWADKPEVYLASPALPMLKEMPYEFDETIVLPGTEIGECVIFARRVGKTWWIAAINGTKVNRDIEIPVKTFLKTPKAFTMDAAVDVIEDGKCVPAKLEYTAGAPVTSDVLKYTLVPGGGVTLRFTTK